MMRLGIRLMSVRDYEVQNRYTASLESPSPIGDVNYIADQDLAE
jgi:hypothetical protein